MKFLSPIVAALAMVLGCSPPPKSPVPEPLPPVVEFHGDTEFSEADRYSIQKAADVWSLQTNGQAKITIKYDLNFYDMESVAKANLEGWNVIVMLTSETTDEKENVLGFTTSAGIHNPFGVPVAMGLIVDRMSNLDIKNGFELVVLHEMGHALGLPHVTTPAAVMFPSIKSQRLCLTQPDLQMFCMVNVCTKPTIPCEGALRD